MPALDPIVSEFASTEEEEAYDRWFRVKVQEALDDEHLPVPHDQVVTESLDIVQGRAKP